MLGPWCTSLLCNGIFLSFSNPGTPQCAANQGWAHKFLVGSAEQGYTIRIPKLTCANACMENKFGDLPEVGVAFGGPKW